MMYKGPGNAKPRKFASLEKLDWCASVKNPNIIDNPFARNTFQMLKAYMPDYFMDCPFSGVLKAINLTATKNMLTIMPLGTYVVKVAVYDKIAGPKQLKVKCITNYSYVPD